jgi:hypothetical protein
MAWFIDMLGTFSLISTGRRSRRFRIAGWTLGILVQVVWGWYAVRTNQLPFLATSFLYGSVSAWNLHTALKSHDAPRR